MIIVDNYFVAVTLCVVSMVCWGSWANTQKMSARTWRFELFYWDLAIGLVVCAVIAAFTAGSMGSSGRTFLEDLRVADGSSILYAMLGGAVWNLGNLLLVAAIAIAGLAVGFPIGGGIAWILGILVNYILVMLDPNKKFEGSTFLLFSGMAVIVAAIVLSMFAYRRLAAEKKTAPVKGILLSVSAGLLIAFFYGLVVKSLDHGFVSGGTGTLTPYTAVFFFSIGIFVSTILFNPLFMAKPVSGPPVFMREYWKGSFRSHMAGVLGGFIWMFGMVVSFMAVGAANPAIAYALSNAAPVVAILWGLFVWKEFKDAPKGTNLLLSIMFLCYLVGLALITYSNT